MTRGNPNSPDYPLDGRLMAKAATGVIATLLERGIRAPDSKDIFRAVAAHPATREALTYQCSARQRLRGATASYFRFFEPDPQWRFTGAGLTIDGANFDLVWEDSSQQVWVDALYHQPAEKPGRPEFDARIEATLEAARQAFAPRFGGLRVLCLRHPALSGVRT